MAGVMQQLRVQAPGATIQIPIRRPIAHKMRQPNVSAGKLRCMFIFPSSFNVTEGNIE